MGILTKRLRFQFNQKKESSSIKCDVLLCQIQICQQSINATSLCFSTLSQMPSNVIERVDLFLRAGKYPEGASKSSKAVTRAASKHFVFKGIIILNTVNFRYLSNCGTQQTCNTCSTIPPFILQMTVCGEPIEGASLKSSGAMRKCGRFWPVTITITTTLVGSVWWKRSWWVQIMTVWLFEV